ELHIEQGPVLEAEGLPVGVVTAISGFSRLRCTLGGTAGPAGTGPMRPRRGAPAGAAGCVPLGGKTAEGNAGLVGPGGRTGGRPGPINVIPGETAFTVDIRAPQDKLRESAVQSVLADCRRIALQRKLDLRIEPIQSMGVASCAPRLMVQMERAVAAEGVRVLR